LIADYRSTYKAMAQLYQFTPQEVSNMTFAQVSAYLGEERKLSPAQIKRYVEKNYGG